MRRFTYLAAAVAAVATAGAAQAQDAPRFQNGSQVVIVAPLQADTPMGAGQIQIPVGPNRTMMTLNLGTDIRAYDQTGKGLTGNQLKRGWWIRANGKVGENPQTVQITDIEVLGQGPEAESSAFYRRGFPTGYVSLVGGSREIFPMPQGDLNVVEPTILVGRIAGAADAANRTLRVRAGANEWTIRLAESAALQGQTGSTVTLAELAPGSWIRVEGWQDGHLNLRGIQLRAIAPADAAYKSSEFYREGYDQGYVTRVVADRLTVRPMRVSGTVASIDREKGTFVVRTADGKEHTVRSEAARFRVGDQASGLANLKVGDKVEVAGRVIGTGSANP